MRILLATVGLVVGLILASPVVFITLFLWSVAASTRLISHVFEVASLSWEEVISFDENMGWRPKPNLDTYCRFGPGLFHIKTDKHGWGGTTSLADSQIVVFGDSFAFGYGVDAERMFSERARTRVKPIGSPGYNMVQELLWIERLSEKLKNKLVVWFIYYGNDLYDNLQPSLYRYRTPFVRRPRGSGEWRIETGHISQREWPFYSDQRSRRHEKLIGTFVDGFLSERIYSACEFLIAQGKEICDRAEARLVILTIPWVIQLDGKAWERAKSGLKQGIRMQPDLPDQKIADICQRLHVPLLPGKDYLGLTDHIPSEGHWNERGHQCIARVIETLHAGGLPHTSFEVGPIRREQPPPSEGRPAQSTVLKTRTTF